MAYSARKYKKSLRLDGETIDIISQLTLYNISWQKLIIDDVESILKSKLEEHSVNTEEIELPF